jgi:hypothetical protein
VILASNSVSRASSFFLELVLALLGRLDRRIHGMISVATDIFRGILSGWLVGGIPPASVGGEPLGRDQRPSVLGRE